MTKLKLFTLLAAAFLLPASMLAQATATIHGHVNNAAGMVIPGAKVKLTTDKSADSKDRKYQKSVDVDGNGDYKITGIAPGDYMAVVAAGKADSVDFQDVTLKSGDDKQVDFDMTRKEYIDKMTPEEKAALEEYKKKTGATVNANKVVANLNNTLKTVRADLTAAAATSGDVSKDVTLMKSAVDTKPDEGVLWINYGDTLRAQGEYLAKTAKAAGKSPLTDEAVQKTFGDAVAAYQKGIDLEAASKKPMPADEATAYNQMGNTLAAMHKIPEAVAAFEKAAGLTPASAGMYYGNEAAVLFNNGATQEAAVAADKAIAVDPTRPDPYYVKGQALITQATVVNGKIVAPQACIEAYQKYLELDPTGKFAPTVKEILAGMGQSVTTKYKAGRK